jgi:hypothetical protein
VHELVASQDGVGGASFDAECASDAPILVNHCQGSGAFHAMISTQKLNRLFSNLGDSLNTLRPAWRALIDRGL